MPSPFEDEDPTFLQRHSGLALIAVIIVLGVAVYFASKALSGHQSSARQEDLTSIRLPPPPPPPPPKIQPTPPPQQQPTPPQQQEQKMVEQQPVQDEKKPDPPRPKAPDAPLGTSISGPGGGPDLGLGSGLGGGGGYGSGGGGGGSKYGWYASEVQSRIADAVRGNPKTRKAAMNVKVYIWPDSTGRITRARVSGGSDEALDAALQNDILTGLQLTDPPPSDMPLPIVMRLTAQRPQ
jgi:outer membrane biosynthesis protein TonB